MKELPHYFGGCSKLPQVTKSILILFTEINIGLFKLYSNTTRSTKLNLKSSGFSCNY